MSGGTVCPRRSCRYHTQGKQAMHSCDYASLTGHCRTAGLTPEQRLDFAACPCYASTKRKRSPEARPPAYGQAVERYNWVRARELWAQGLSDKEIGAALGASRSAVQKWRQKHRLACRTGRGRR